MLSSNLVLLILLACSLLGHLLPSITSGKEKAGPISPSPPLCPPCKAHSEVLKDKMILPPWMRSKQGAPTFLEVAQSLGSGVTDKVSHHHYEVIYERYLGPYRNAGEPFNFLEIGIGCGTPTGVGRGYQLYTAYAPMMRYSGIELHQSCTKRIRGSQGYHLNESEKSYLLSHVQWGDQSSLDVMKNAVRRFGVYDFIVDDGSHYSIHQIASFEYLFLHGLRPGGAYIIEDLHTSFLGMFKVSDSDQRNGQTMVEYIRSLILDLHYPGKVGKYFNVVPHVHHAEIMKWIRTVDCDRRVCALTKRLQPVGD